MKKKYTLLSVLLSVLSVLPLFSRASHAQSPSDLDLLSEDLKRPLLFLEHSADKPEILLAAHRSHSSHRSHASHVSHRSGSYSTSTPTYSAPPARTYDTSTPRTYDNPTTPTYNSSAVKQSTEPSYGTSNNLVGKNSSTLSQGAAKSSSAPVAQGIKGQERYTAILKNGSTIKTDIYIRAGGKIKISPMPGASIEFNEGDVLQVKDNMTGEMSFPK